MMVLMLVVDSLRADAPGFAGGEARTPGMDALAAGGTRVPHMTVSGSWTVPSLTSMMTGAYPHRVGIVRWRHRFPRHRPTLMSAFAAAGFDVHLLAHNPRWVFGACPHRGTVGDSQEPVEVERLLRDGSGRDSFVLLHHWWTHLPYLNRKLPVSGWKKACEVSLDSLNRDPEVMAPKFRTLYHKTIEYFDHELLPRYLDAAASGGQDLLVILTADHGENWGEALPRGRRIEHIFDMHGRWLRDGTAHVPLVWWGRAAGGRAAGGRGAGGAIPAGVTLGGTVRGVDMAPTIADLAGIPWPGPIPQHDGPTLADRGIGPDGERLVLDGRSVAPAVMASEDLGRVETLTVATHNTHEPDTYPASGQVAFRTMGRRIERAWMVFDGVDDVGDVYAEDGGEAPEPTDAQWQPLIEHWRAAVSPGEGLDRELYPRFSGEPDGPDGPEAEADEIRRKMRMLGYMD